jgi:hypothetical protein
MPRNCCVVELPPRFERHLSAAINPSFHRALYRFLQLGKHKPITMTQADTEQGHDDSGYEEGVAGGPGAPMHLSQLVVCLFFNPKRIYADLFLRVKTDSLREIFS